MMSLASSIEYTCCYARSTTMKNKSLLNKRLHFGNAHTKKALYAIIASQTGPKRRVTPFQPSSRKRRSCTHHACTGTLPAGTFGAL